ncbi:MAG TPA: hypothetical protein EYP06_05150, partial [Desulfobacterales bacterium]|nr:hypothetical protein [Desulfobacterales bacterium]
DKIEKQLKKHLSKLRGRRPEGEVEESITEEELEEPIIEVERLVAKPMDPEEAAMQINLTNQDFIVFRNAKSQEINVLYKKKDGNLGLIEPAG